MNWLGNRVSQFIGFSFLEWKFGYFVLFVSVLSHSVSELYTVCFFFFLVSLLCKEFSEKFLELFSIGSIGWGTGSASFSGFVRVVRFQFN